MSPLTSTARVLLPLAIFIASSASAGAQASPTRECEPAAPGRLGTTLPTPVLDRISGLSASPFAHAFVLAHVAGHGRQDHWLVRCIAAFRTTPTTDLARLTALRVDMETVLAELRSENAVMREEARIRASAGGPLRAVLEKAVAGMTVDMAEAIAPTLGSVRSLHCGRSNSPASICNPLARVLEGTAALPAIVQRGRVAAGQLASINTLSAQLAQQLEEAVAAIAADSSILRQVQGKDSSTRVVRAVDTTVVNQQIAARAVARKAAADSLARLKATATALANDVSTVDNDQKTVLAAITTAATSLLRALSGDDSPNIATPVAVLAPADASPIAADLPDTRPVTSLAAVPASQAPSVALALADFVIDRAKQELVFAFIAAMYDRINRDDLLKVAFPETYLLMKSLASQHGGTLSVPTAARVPVNAWRATVTADFLKLADHLVAADPGVVCGSSTPCRERVVQLRPFAAASGRILTGDPVLDVIRDLPAAMGKEWIPTAPGPAMNGILRGAHVVSGLAEAYYAQGATTGADPQRHPYILTPRALSHVTSAQRELFIRLLIARTAKVAGPFATTLNDEELAATLMAVTRVIDQMQARADRDGAPDIRLLVQQAFRTMGQAAAVGQLLAADSTPRVRAIHDRWMAFANVVDPIVSRDYGLVLGRSAQLYTQLTDNTPPPMLLTFASLGASLAEAQDGAQMRAAFEAAAAPVGGWQAKRFHQGPRTTITALPGVIGGGEKLIGGGWGSSAGISMPIGFDVQLTERLSGTDRTKGCTVWLCSAGLFIPVVDLGALASYRFDDDPLVESEPRASFRQVFAPGVYFSFGIRRSPAALLLGGQLMPSLRSVDPSRGSGTDGHAFRIGAGLAVDVVLLNVSGN